MLTLGHILETLSDYRATGNEPAVSSFVVDSREAGPGAVFVTFVGERADGHAFVADAFARGAIAALVERAPVGDWPVIDARKPEEGPTWPLAPGPFLPSRGHRRRRHPERPASAGRRLARPIERPRHWHHRQRRQDLDQGVDRHRPPPPLHHVEVERQPEQRDRRPPDAAQSAAGTRAGGHRDGHVRPGRDRPALQFGPTAYRRRDDDRPRPHGAPRLAGGHRRRQARAGGGRRC